MRRTLIGSVAAVLIATAVAAAGVDAQDTQPPAPDSAQGMMQQMMQRMQSMQQMMHDMMQQMQSRQQMMQDMMQQMHGGQGMQGMQGMSGQAQGASSTQNCIVSGPQGVLSALLMGSVSDLALTEAQRTELSDLLERAQGEALEALTEEQRALLEAAPVAPSAGCGQEGATAHGGHAGH